MERVNKIFNNILYKEYLNKLEAYEEKREFCRHNLEHFLDMSRIAYMMVLEKNLQYSKEVIYAIGLLHDIGRVEQYEKGIGHHIASFNIAKEILKDIDFKEEEKILMDEKLNLLNTNKTYTLYLYYLNNVNNMIELIKDELNDYFYKVTNIL